jgi:hypothetical protein
LLNNLNFVRGQLPVLYALHINLRGNDFAFSRKTNTSVASVSLQSAKIPSA